VTTMNHSSKFGAAIRVFGRGLDFDEIARMLGLTPSHSHKAGDLDSFGKSFTDDMWMVGSPLDKSAPMDAHLWWLRHALLPHRAFLLSLREKAKVDIYCNAMYFSEQSSLTISSEALRIFVDLNLPLAVSLLFLPEDNSAGAQMGFSDGALNPPGGL
jgi:hypothetical protein